MSPLPNLTTDFAKIVRPVKPAGNGGVDPGAVSHGLDGLMRHLRALEVKVNTLIAASTSYVGVTGTTSATPGTRTTHAHGGASTPLAVMFQVTAPNDDVDNAGPGVALVSSNATNIVVKSSGASVTFLAVSYFYP